MKKIVSILLTVVLVLTCIPTVALADASSLIEVTKDNAPIRATPYQEGTIITKCKKGAVLEYEGYTINQRLHRWYEVKWNGQKGYIYSGNVEKHEHSYQTLTTINDLTIKICNGCGDCYANGSKYEIKEGNALILAAPLEASLGLAAVDGPLPIGDVVGLILAVTAICVYSDVAVPSAKEFASTITEADIIQDLLIKKTVCTPYNYHLVQRYSGGLKYLSPYCMDIYEAMAVGVLLGMDVYTESEDSAMMLALAFDGSAIAERDKDQLSYFYHYHYGVDRKVKAHVFFGLNDYGMGPTY